MGVIDFIKGGSREDKNFDRQMRVEEDKISADYSARSNEWATAGQDSQVNLYIVSNARSFLPKKAVRVKNNGVEEVVWVRKEDYADFLEPFSNDDSLSFVDKEIGRNLADKLLQTNIAIIAYADKYKGKVDRQYWADEFNFWVRMRENLLCNSRITGDPIRAAKSQSVSSSATIVRANEEKKQFGLI